MTATVRLRRAKTRSALNRAQLTMSPMKTIAHPAAAETRLPERLVTDVELANRLGISRRHIHVLRAQGQLRGIKLGGSLRFPINENLQRVLGTGGTGTQSGGIA